MHLSPVLSFLLKPAYRIIILVSSCSRGGSSYSCMQSAVHKKRRKIKESGKEKFEPRLRKDKRGGQGRITKFFYESLTRARPKFCLSLWPWRGNNYSIVCVHALAVLLLFFFAVFRVKFESRLFGP